MWFPGNASYTESAMHEVRTDIEIEATPERVWSILLDFPSHPDWNPFVRSIKGVAKVGDRLTVFIQPQGGKGMTFHPAILTVIPNAELRWRGRFFLPGIFDGEHYFQINQIAPRHVRFVQGEKFSGVLVPFAKSRLDGGTKAGFIAMNQAL
ncbi:MAG TPA: SRPBCC domain-containing protein, partial [Bryobacteraceae bacterium]|nr:SRPBCC domain-containing protein [Bryobacteraceae bacterium]